MVWDHLKWVIGPPQWGIWLGGVAVLLTDFFYTVCRGCGILQLSDSRVLISVYLSLFVNILFLLSLARAGSAVSVV